MVATEKKKGILSILRKHSRPILAGLGMMTALGFGSGAVKRSAEKPEPAPIEQSAQPDGLSQMPKSYTDKFQALDDEYVLETAWKMITNGVDDVQYEMEQLMLSYESLSEYDQHMLDLDERALTLSLNELKQLPKKRYSSARQEALKKLQTRFEDQLVRVRSGHGLLQCVPAAQGYAKWGNSTFSVGVMNRKKGSKLLSAQVLSKMYEICVEDKKGNIDERETIAKRDAYLKQVGREIMSDNAPRVNRRLKDQRG